MQTTELVYGIESCIATIMRKSSIPISETVRGTFY